jgi:Flp pilus assembly protein TadG
MTMLKRRHCRKDRCRGSAQVEFALTFPTVFFLLFWTIEFALLLNTYIVMSEAAKEGARYAVVHGSDYSSGTCPHNGTYDRVQQYLQYTWANTSGFSVCVSYPDGAPAGTALARVNVTVTYGYLPFLITRGWTPPNITASAAGRIIF